MGPSVAKHLLDRCGTDPGHAERLEREIEKLALYCRGQEADRGRRGRHLHAGRRRRDLRPHGRRGHRDRAHSFALLEALYAPATRGNDANGVLYSLKRHVEQLDAASQLPHADQTTAAKQFSVHPFTAKKLLEQREHFDRRRIGRAYRALARPRPACAAARRSRSSRSAESTTPTAWWWSWRWRGC